MKGIVLQCELRNQGHVCCECNERALQFIEEVFDILIYVPKVRHYGLYACALCGKLQMQECQVIER